MNMKCVKNDRDREHEHLYWLFCTFTFGLFSSYTVIDQLNPRELIFDSISFPIT